MVCINWLYSEEMRDFRHLNRCQIDRYNCTLTNIITIYVISVGVWCTMMLNTHAWVSQQMCVSNSGV